MILGIGCIVAAFYTLLFGMRMFATGDAWEAAGIAAWVTVVLAVVAGLVALGVHLLGGF